MRKKMISIFALLFSVVLLAGCATTMPMSPSEQKHIHTVYVNPKVTLSADMYYAGSGAGFMFGLVGAVVQKIAEITPKEHIELHAKQHHIFIDQIVKDAFVQQVYLGIPHKTL